MPHPDERDIPWHAFVLAALLMLGAVAALVDLLEMRAQNDCEEHGGMVVEIRNGWACFPPHEEE